MKNAEKSSLGFFGMIKQFIIDKKTEKLRKSFVLMHEKSKEMVFLDTEVEWREASKLIFFTVLKKMHDSYGQLLDYGFIRLCAEWLELQNVRVLDNKGCLQMLKAILPSNSYDELVKKLQAMKKRG